MTTPRVSAIRFKSLAALLGAGAVVTMGVVAAATGASTAGDPALASATMQVGETTTVTYQPTIEAVRAVPPVKAPAYGKK
jgi:hypothetical protein